MVSPEKVESRKTVGSTKAFGAEGVRAVAGARQADAGGEPKRVPGVCPAGGGLAEEGRSILRDLYEWVLSWSGSPWAVLALFVLAFAESSFFPVPPDVLLMALAMGAVRAGVAAQGFWFALVCSVGSVLGGCFGYGLGVFARPAVVDPLVRWLRWERHFKRAREMYERYDVWAVAIAGFTPIPYKIFTIAGGVARIDFLRFVLASAASRSARFFLVAGFFYFFGDVVEPFIKKYFELLTLLFTVLLVGGFLAMRLLWKRKRRSG